MPSLTQMLDRCCDRNYHRDVHVVQPTWYDDKAHGSSAFGLMLPRCLDIRWFGCHHAHDTSEPIRGAFGGLPPKNGHVVS